MYNNFYLEKENIMQEEIFALARTKLVNTPKGEEIIRTYDWIAPFPKGRYQMTRKKERYGIIKRVGKTMVEILEPSAVKLPVLEDLFMYGVTVVHLENETVLIDTTGKMLQKGQNIWVIDENLVSVEVDENRYILYNPLRDKTTEGYSDFELYENYIETHEGKLKGLLTRDFIEVFKPEFEEVKPFGGCFIGIKPDGTKVLGCSRWGKTIEAEEVFPEKNGFITIRSKTRYGYVEVETGRRIQFMLLDAQDFDDRGYARVVHPGLGPCWMDRNFNFLMARED